MASQTCIKKKSVPSKEAKARKKVTYLHGNILQLVSFFFVCGIGRLFTDKLFSYRQKLGRKELKSV